MKQYLLSIYQPDGPRPPPERLDAIMRDVHAVMTEMQKAGAWVFSGGLHLADVSTVVREGKEPLITDGPYLEGKEHVGGFTIVRAPDLDAAIAWARKVSKATTLPIEVRPFQHSSLE